MKTLKNSLGPLFLTVGCSSPNEPEVSIALESGSPAAEVQPEHQRGPQNWAPNFPAQADLAILLDVLDKPLVDTSTRDGDGARLFPEAWLGKIEEAYASTDVSDALQRENTYTDWRLVSVRISPCAPVGISPDVDIDEWCWPTVRLVWQPVVEGLRSGWGTIMDFYADDRAAHTIYPVRPRNPDGIRIEGAWREHVAAHLAAGRRPEDLDPRLVEGFSAVRDATAIALLNGVAALRDPAIAAEAYEDIELRPEVQGNAGVESRFQQRLTSFLGEFASWQDLEEMTSFSLPEGRNPSASDIWTFVGFDGNNGFPSLKDLTVIGRDSGQQLVNIGPDQTVALGVEDEAVQAEIAAGNNELSLSVIISASDIEDMGAEMADPYAFLVPNTSCASCHRLNGLRFDFHSLSGFEDRGITVSPRVTKDVARDMFWARSALLR